MTRVSTRFVRSTDRRGAAEPDLHVAIDDRWEHVSRCLGVTHDGFVESGFMDPTESGLRVIREYRNPGTSFIVCFDGEVPVGSAVVVSDGPYGLPADRAFGPAVGSLRATTTLAEAGSLAVARSHRRHVRPIVQRLFVGIYLAACRVDCETIVIAGNTSHLGFWRRALNFELIGEPVEHFGVPAICLATPRERYGDAFRAPVTANQVAMATLFDTRGRWLYDALAATGVAWDEAPAPDTAGLSLR